MRLMDIVNGAWAITPEMLGEIRSIYAKHLRGEKINIKDLETQIGIPLQRKEQKYEKINGTAIIPIEGVIGKKMNLLMHISGGASTQLIERDIKAALADPAVKRIILNIDSPGGTVDGVFELANFIFASRGIKPIIAYSDGQMLSAAYAIGAAADAIYISGDTVAVGSIGIVAAHEDWSKYEEKKGIKTTEIYTGKYKRIVSQYQPLSEEGRQAIQDEVDYLYSVFVDTVAKFRGVTPEIVQQRMSTEVKRYFIGREAIEAGLVDGVSTLDKLIHGVDSANNPLMRRYRMATAEELKETHPELYEMYEKGRLAALEECKAAIEAARKEGAEAERRRIKAVRDQTIAGHEALIETLMWDGVTTGEQAAVKVLAAEKALRESKLEAYLRDGAKVIPPSIDESASQQITYKQFKALTPEEQRAFLKGGGKIINE